MKIAFPTNKGDKIAKHSSFSKSFLIIDTKTQERTTVANPVKQRITTTDKSTDKQTGRHLGTGPIVAALLADAGVDVYVYFEAEERFIRHLQREGIAVYTTQERQIETALKEAIENIEQADNADLDDRQGLGRRRGEGRGLGQGRGQDRGMGQGQGRGQGRGMGQGQGRGQGRGMREGQGLGRGMHNTRPNNERS